MISIATAPAGADTAPAVSDPWMAAMRRGDFESAWSISDDVLHAHAGIPCFDRPRHEQYIWNGEPLTGKRVLVRCYHGLGDTVQFIRFLPLLRRIAQSTIVWAQPVLLPLLATAEGIDELLPLHDGAPDVAYDVDIELMELAHALRITEATLPRHVPYLRVPPPQHGLPERNDGMPVVRPAVPPRRLDHLGGRLQVGLVWRSGDWDERRSLPIRALEPLSWVRGVDLIPLQLGPALAEWPRFWGRPEANEDVVALARRLATLDLLMTVDSFPAHLAGALAVPTWTLLHTDPDWRWMLGRDDSPWYPTMRLFRQSAPGAWSPVIERVMGALELVVEERMREAAALPA